MDHVAHNVGISKRTLYELFESKDSLVVACLKHQHKQAQLEMAELAKNYTNSIEFLIVLFKDGLRKLAHTNRNYFRDLKRYHAKIIEDHNRRLKYNTDNIIALIEEGVKEGLIRPNINGEIVSLLLNKQIEVLIDSEEFGLSHYSLSEIFETIVLNFTRGIATTKGVEVLDKFIENWSDTDTSSKNYMI